MLQLDVDCSAARLRATEKQGSFIRGFVVGLEAAAKMHERMAEDMRKRANDDSLSYNTKIAFISCMERHQGYALAIRALKEKE